MPKLVGTVMRFNFSSPLNMGRILDKYKGVRDGDNIQSERAFVSNYYSHVLNLFIVIIM